ncbi:MAG: family N-acetyltransferase, partial [Deltaproteobacteria bacterium]|nr:family N-acetyltransferase [Deltaproteobacteria bacterium]
MEVVPGHALSPEIRNDWERILRKIPHGNPFLSPLWVEVWLKHFGHSLEPKMMLFRGENEDLQGIGHLLRTADGTKNGLILSGSRDVWDYRDFVIQPGLEEEAFKSLCFLLKDDSLDFIELSSIAQISPTAEIFPKVMESCGFRVSREMEETVINLSLPATWGEFLEALNAKDRHELRRKIR